MTGLALLILFLTALIPGLVIIYYPGARKPDIKYMLVFAGAFIFSITMVHLLPELMSVSTDPKLVGIFVLVGFIMQMLLDFITSGVEHGHMHNHSQHGRISPIILMSGLCLHAIMDGSILVHPGHQHGAMGNSGLMFGIVLHKIPEAIALIAVLSFVYKNKLTLLAFLIVFSLASPLGLLLSEMLSHYELLGKQGFILLFAIVSGNLIHISTTIYFETSPDHSFHKKRAIIGLLGTLLAILTEIL
ncbi:MAG: zinc permease [Cyclobacteriaceae bacterium]|nr:zinc permease [Cyclobacteriaceae bacterium]